MTRLRRRGARTVILGVLAMAALVWAAVDQFGIAPEEIGSLLLATVIGTLLVIAAAALAVLLWTAVRALFDRRD